MTTSFMAAERLLFTSESVTEGHPDKLCDQVSDAVLDDLLRQDPNSRVACETATTTGTVFVLGEITTHGYVDLQKLVREVVKDIGYTDAATGFDYQTCGVISAIKPQSHEIAQGVDHSLESKQGVDPDELGAGDQGMMFGFAVDETPELMPLPITLAHSVARRLSEARKRGDLSYLRPDGKSQVTVEYSRGRPVRIDKVVVAAQHDPGIPYSQLRDDIVERVVRPACGELIDARTTYVVNGTGAFTIGGPMGDAGLTGRKIIVDTYGGYARHGGGAFSGKDATKVDRSASYAARYVAKNVVAAGLATRCEIQVAYVIGVAHPVSVNVETFGTATVPEDRIRALVDEHFDFRPGAIIERFGLRRPIFRQTASYGHFGRPDLRLPWEETDMAAALRASAGPKRVTTPVS
jgi:S-adenosylmethionine synthetase